MRISKLLLGLIFSVLAAGSSGGCDFISAAGPSSCDDSDEDNQPVNYSAGTVEGGIYMSSPWNKDLLNFPGGMVIRFEHKLGTTPRAWQAYLSFDNDGVTDGTLALASGNQVELVGIDDQSITLKNVSCTPYWLVVTAEAGSLAAPSTGSASFSAGGAGGAGGS